MGPHTSLLYNSIGVMIELDILSQILIGNLVFPNLDSDVNNTAKNLPQITAHTDASVVVWVKFVSVFINRSY